MGVSRTGGDTTSTDSDRLGNSSVLLRKPGEACLTEGGGFGATASLAAYTHNGRGEAFSLSALRRPAYPTGFAG